MHQLPRLYTEAANTVKLIRIALRWCIAFSLHGSYMEQNRAVQLLRIAQKLRQILDIMPIHWSQVGKAHILKQAARQQTVLDGRLDLVGCMVDVTAQRQYAHDLTVALLKRRYWGFSRWRAKCSATPPTLFVIDMPLSLRMTMSGSPLSPHRTGPHRRARRTRRRRRSTPEHDSPHVVMFLPLPFQWPPILS